MHPSSATAPQSSKTPTYGDLIPHAELLRIVHELSPDAMLDVGRAALVLGLTANTLNHWRSDGKPPPFTKFGSGRTSVVRYRLGELRKFQTDNTFSDTAHALEAATRLIHVEFHEFFPEDADEGFDAQVDTTQSESDTSGDKPSAPPSHPPHPPHPPVAPPVIHTEEKPRRDDMLDAVSPFWFCKPYVLDTALSRRADFREHFLSERVKVEWWTWRKALGMLWLEEPVWQRRVEAARVKRSGFDLGEAITEHEVKVARESTMLSYEKLLKFLGLRPRVGVKPSSKTATSYIP